MVIFGLIDLAWAFVLGWYLLNSFGLDLGWCIFIEKNSFARLLCLRKKVRQRKKRYATSLLRLFIFNTICFRLLFKVLYIIYIRPVHILRICVYILRIYTKG